MRIEEEVGGSGAAGLRCEFLGLYFDTLRSDQVVGFLNDRQDDCNYAYMVNPNVDHVVRLTDPQGMTDRTLWEAYTGADLCVCDSRILARLAGLRGVRLPVVPGSDMTWRLFTEVAQAGDRIALVGGDSRHLMALEATYPELDLVQHIPPMALRHNEQALQVAAQFIVAARARFILLAVGSPQQELLAALVASDPTATGFALCIGAAVDFAAGIDRRAPVILQKLHLEWLHRLVRDPRRLWRRYLVDGMRIFGRAASWQRNLP